MGISAWQFAGIYQGTDVIIIINNNKTPKLAPPKQTKTQAILSYNSTAFKLLRNLRTLIKRHTLRLPQQKFHRPVHPQPISHIRNLQRSLRILGRKPHLYNAEDGTVGAVRWLLVCHFELQRVLHACGAGVLVG